MDDEAEPGLEGNGRRLLDFRSPRADKQSATKIYDAAMEPPRYKDALRDKPVAIRLAVCLFAFAIAMTVVVHGNNLLNFWGSETLFELVGAPLFWVLAVGPLHYLGAVDLGKRSRRERDADPDGHPLCLVPDDSL